jgi:hypothetical protein
MTRLRHARWPILLLALSFGVAPHRAIAVAETAAVAHAQCAETETERAEPCGVALCCFWIASEARGSLREPVEPPLRPLQKAGAASAARAPPSPPPRLG